MATNTTRSCFDWKRRLFLTAAVVDFELKPIQTVVG